MTAIEVNYQESINDNEEFFGTDLQAPLSQGKSTGWDIVVLTDFMAARLIRLGWVETIDTAGMKNFPKNLEDAYLTRSFDPGAKMTAPWQSGMTGLGFDAAKTGELDSIEAFWDAKYKGKVDYLSEMRDTVGLSAIRLGFDPGAITDEQYDQALAEVKKAIDSKLVRTIKGNDYLADLASGDVVLSMSWSGDIQLQPTRRPSSSRSPRRVACCGRTMPSPRAPRTRSRPRRSSTSTTTRRSPPGRGLRELRLSGQGRQGRSSRSTRQRQQPVIFAGRRPGRVHVKGLDEATRRGTRGWNTVIGL